MVEFHVYPGFDNLVNIPEVYYHPSVVEFLRSNLYFNLTIVAMKVLTLAMVIE
jgi:hypothetical protein